MNFNIFQIRSNLQTILIAHDVKIVKGIQIHFGEYFVVLCQRPTLQSNQPLGDLDDINMFGCSSGE